MTQCFLARDKSNLLLRGAWGLEKESQRVTREGDLALTDHPQAFGNKLHHPTITTDFAESQLEMITPPLSSVQEVYQFLHTVHDEVENGIGDELLWPLSMPPRLPDEELIRIAEYDDSPAGRKSEIYRESLALRYGKKMQMISGLHVNFSFADELLHYLADQLAPNEDRRAFINQLYFRMARNFLRYRWLLIYLYGASPTIDASYDSVICEELDVIENKCSVSCNTISSYEQYATSLRVSRFGYSNTLQRNFIVSFNHLDEYLSTYRKLLTTRSEEYEKLGLFKQGKQIQLNANILQIENEFYSSIRLKQRVQNDETVLDALEKQGVRYVEIRLMDLNPYERVGVSKEQLHFVHVFLLYCLFEESPYLHDAEWDILNKNHHLVSLFGRRPNLELHHPEQGNIPMTVWAKEIFKRLNLIADLMDRAQDEVSYRQIVSNEERKIEHSDQILSAQILREMADHSESFIDFGLRRALMNRAFSISLCKGYC